MAQSFYRTYRPQTFKDVVGQNHIVSTFEHALAHDNLSHAYLFTGPRGTGKTSMARLLAKALLCQAEPDKRPDGTCEICESIAQGNHPDVYELDAASRTGVDNVRDEIINKVNFSPTQGAYKLYIIDEVHMLSTQAFNALLKTLEEPPSHVVFILCTTDPQKVPDTILSRCQRFDFKAISQSDISSQLVKVAKAEGIEYEKEALDLIAEQAHGGMRDALSSFEQISVFSAGKLTLESARSILGQTDRQSLYSFTLALASRNAEDIFAQIEELNQSGVNYQRFVEDEAKFLRDVYVYALAGQNALEQAVTTDEADKLEKLTNQFSGTDSIRRSLLEFGELIREMRFSTHPRLSLEIAATKLVHPEYELNLESLSERLEKLESRSVQVQAVQTVQTVQAAEEAPVTQVPQKATVEKRPDLMVKPKVREQMSQKDSKDLRALDTSEIQRSWDQARAHVSAKSQAKGVLLNNTHVSVTDEGVLAIEFPEGSEFTLSLMKRDDVSEMLKESIEEAFGFIPPFSFCIGHACALEDDKQGVESKLAPPEVERPIEVPQEPEPSNKVIETPPQNSELKYSGDLPDNVADMLTEGFGKGWKIIE